MLKLKKETGSFGPTWVINFWSKCGPAVYAREVLKDYEILHLKHVNKLTFDK